MAEVYHIAVHFSGRVQGVGFRYSAHEVARGFEVSGFVRNLDDGRVLLEAEGQRDEVEAFLAAVRERMDGYIRNAQVTGEVRRGQFAGFRIA